MIGIVLAGGESRRFGSPKAFGEYGGRFFYEYAAEALALHCMETVIAARPEYADRFPDAYTVILDVPEYAGHGPLAGILAAMETIDSDWYAVLPCDVPFADSRIFDVLLAHREDGGEVIALEAEDRLHPLLSIWHRRSAPRIREALESGRRSVRPLIDTWADGSRLLEENPAIFDNVNRPGQLEGR
ncbi:putative molybdenum cofactor guanylyltransferase [Sporosarcina sp. NCCP-2716]|uniref:molybdenum cofactor guanylyltransferase n=1 Tax=Sporosarcina sp. NCCP-2716 TaxID=2943679 RepID=UPI00203F94B5|nr:molybdenum cofactor guanylyltransferase [Sporosarcina sp. NCCP-2716]GKV69047.1 putative molybdenum cofactor guanylyltransferase [Sporosarcina sp. NCCP-2716]